MGQIKFLYADVNGFRRKPFKGGKGTCTLCAGSLTACCGELVSDYWRHDSLDDCDRWSEGITQWHLDWQEFVAEQFREVPLPQPPEKAIHRADIRAACGKVIEIQHSFLSPEEIHEREQFYGNMVWVFDATNGRFPAVPSSDRVFFSLGRTKHIPECRKPIYLDFGNFLVEVEHFTELFDQFSGFGLKRDKRWFAETYLLDSLRIDMGAIPQPSSINDWADRWPGNQTNPWRLTEFPTKWREPQGELVIQERTPYIPLNYSWIPRGQSKGTEVVERLLEIFPQLSNGWDKTEFNFAKAFFNATPMILHGRLRLMPAPLDRLTWRQSYSSKSAADLLQRAEAHINAGRLPILRPETKQTLLERARQNDL